METKPKTVKNSSNQPLYINLPGGRSMKIPARGQAEVEEADLNCSEMAFHRSRGNITLVEAPAAGGTPAAGEAAATGEAAAARNEKPEAKPEAKS